ncbi:PREDICTED: AT-rich interactive domain-containing protein 5-like isoform X2 [Nelumbo nucifera]|uniref:AT-rich interactive domain-containing protein 5-like isoform X2 n=1 Tax=Nelumbo nucifera TaxID=4432 RepID=A0A1U8ARP3_NELNU|nr:PREDICTED: AT-rich interactive domain-containing protein 5-like isoform X2 [Nelumbo nucifera]
MGQDLPDSLDNGPIDVKVEHEEQKPHLEEKQNRVENAESLPELPPTPESSSDDKNLELPGEARLSNDQGSVEPAPEPIVANTCADANGLNEYKSDVEDNGSGVRVEVEAAAPNVGCLLVKTEDENAEDSKTEVNRNEVVPREDNDFKEAESKQIGAVEECAVHMEGSNQSFAAGDESGTEEEQAAFMKELENFFRERNLEFKPPKFYGEGLNCLKLWRAVTRLGGYDKVTSCKLWRQVGESFKPPKTCTTVSWSFRCFYEKALLDYERHKLHGSELCDPAISLREPTETQVGVNQTSGSGRARRDAAARAMQGWHSQRLLGNGEVGDPIIKDKNSISMQKREKQLKNIGSHKRKKPSSLERAVKAMHTKAAKPQMETMVVDIGPPADWVKINVLRTKDCFEVYALVPGLLREEVRVQSDPAGRLVISGEPEQPDNPWGVTPFKKVINLPSRIDPHQTSAVVTLHGQLFVRVPFESDL